MASLFPATHPLCTACPNANQTEPATTIAAARRHHTHGARAQAMLQPKAVDEEAAARLKGVMSLKDARFPWWAVDPALRPSDVLGSAHRHGHNASAVQAYHDGLSPWRLQL